MNGTHKGGRPRLTEEERIARRKETMRKSNAKRRAKIDADPALKKEMTEKKNQYYHRTKTERTLADRNAAEKKKNRESLKDATRHYRKWTIPDKKEVMTSALPTEELAAKLGRTVSAITDMRHKILKTQPDWLKSITITVHSSKSAADHMPNTVKAYNQYNPNK